MQDCGELTEEQVTAARSLYPLLNPYNGTNFPEFWAREGLYRDARWEAIRQQAQEVLRVFPATSG
jgi:hypothetical protein